MATDRFYDIAAISQNSEHIYIYISASSDVEKYNDWLMYIYPSSTLSNCKLYNTIQIFCCVYFYDILLKLYIYVPNMACFTNYTLDFFTTIVCHILDYKSIAAETIQQKSINASLFSALLNHIRKDLKFTANNVMQNAICM